MTLKYCPTCDEEHDVEEEETSCPECGGALESVGDDGDDEEGWDEEEKDWGEE